MIEYTNTTCKCGADLDIEGRDMQCAEFEDGECLTCGEPQSEHPDSILCSDCLEEWMDR